MKTKIAVVGIAVIAAGWWFLSGIGDQNIEREIDDAAELEPLVNRVWIDRIPTDERDKVNVLLMVDDPRAGAFVYSSAFEGDYAAFEWVLDNGLFFHMLQDQTSHRIRARVMRGPNCKPFDYCLRIGGAPRGANRYGSMEEWVIDGAPPAPNELLSNLVETGSPTR